MKRLVAAALTGLAVGLSAACAGVQRERTVAEVMNIEVLSDNGSSQSIRIEERYLLRIEDTDNDGAPDRWSLFENDILRSRAWSRGGRGQPEHQELYDDSGRVVRTSVVLSGSPAADDKDR